MKSYQKSCLLWLLAMGLSLASCGQTNSQSSVPSTPVPEASRTIQNPIAGTSIGMASNDCKRIAFVLFTKTNSDIYTVCPDGSNLTQLTSDPSDDLYPAWSPDGTKVAFASLRDGMSQIYVMGGDGSNPIRLTSDDANDFPIWLPNGKQIAFRTTDTKGLWWWRIINIENKQVSRLTEPSYDFFFQTPAWSPDGQYVAYMSLAEQEQRNDGSSQIHVRSEAGSSDTALTGDIWANINPVWSPDGTKIAFLSERDGTYNSYALYVIAQDGTNLQRLTSPIFSESAMLTWSPDGVQIAISSDAITGSTYIVDVHTGNSRELLHLPDDERASMPSWQH